MSELQRTPLYEHQANLGARFVPFAGWELPVQYSSIVEEHRTVRAAAGVFDVSHMGRLELTSSGAHDRLQGLLSNDLDRISAGQAQYTLLTNATGGIVDDLIAYRRDEGGYLLVVNAANKDAVLEHLPEADDMSARTAMLAVQGPQALERLGIDVERFSWRDEIVLDVPCLVAGTGYTGERGCELICAADAARQLWESILGRGIIPCGLGARDTLRLEVCYPLHGQDLSPERDPYSAGLGWAVSSDKEFVGSDALAAVRARGPDEKLVAFVMSEKGVPRAGMSLVGGGTISSGAFSPTLDVGIGLAYVASDRARVGEPLVVDIRGRHRTAAVVEKPIYRPEQE